jgi:hypothetical protein
MNLIARISPPHEAVFKFLSYFTGETYGSQGWIEKYAVSAPVVSFFVQRPNYRSDKTRFEYTDQNFGVIIPRSPWFESDLQGNGRHIFFTSSDARTGKHTPTK